MPLLDSNGRLFGKLNLFDGFLVLVVLAVAVLAYQRLTVDYRVAPPYALETHQVTLAVDLQLPREWAWLCEEATAGLQETDPRSGEARAIVRGCRLEDGLPLVALQVFAVRDDADRILFEGAPLLPGRTLTLDTETLVLEGVVRRITPEDAP